MTAAKSNHETESTLQAKSNDVPELVVVTSGDAENEDVPERYQTREDLEKALNEAKKSEAHLRKIIDTIPTFAWCGLPDGSKEFFNQRWHDYTGLSLEEAHGWGWKVTIHPDDLELLLDKWFKIIASGEPGEIEARVRRFDGEYRWFLFRTVPVRDDQGKIVRWHGTNTDIEDRKRAEAALHWSETLLAGQKRVVEMIAKGDALPRILDALCRAVEEQSSDVLSSFLLLDANGTHLRHGAAPRLPQSYIDAIDGVAVAPTGGSCITAAYRAAPVVVSDIAVDPLWADYRHLPLAHGLRACWSAPIISSEGKVLGTFAMYYREPRSPSPQDLYVLEQIASLAAISIKHQRAEEKLRQDEMELRRIVDAVPHAINVMDPNGKVLYANKGVLDYTGLSIEDVKAEDFRARIFHADDFQNIKVERERLLAAGLPFEIEQRARRKDGQYRWFLIRYNPLHDEQGHIIRWYATGTDIEDRKQAEQRIRNENLALREEIDRASMFEEIVGLSEALRKVLAQISKVAPTDSTVLILGETGTGKELIARAIHRRSKRSARAFIRVNCAAIPSSLIASELFGHEKGAFTGALQRRLGRFELADGGTIFLDEIGDLPADTQNALLRVLQEREFERVGGTQTIRVNVRVIAATNRDLKTAVAAGTFRQDLFYRLNVFPIQVPPLRQRAADIRLLVEYFVDRYAKKAGKKIRSIEEKTLELFRAYKWPGNIRELQNVIERAVILCDGETFSVDETWLIHESSHEPHPLNTPARRLLRLDEDQEKEMIEAALAESKGRVAGPSGAAIKLGIPRQTLESKIANLGINKHQFKCA
jgi:formate hydrogenlyase transcriptional activator